MGSTLCLTPNCGLPAKTRGLCAPCYSAARLRVSSGLTSWEELEANGLTLSSRANPSNAFAAALEKQLGIEEVARRQQAVAASRSQAAAEREVDAPPTMQEIRALAQKVATNPSSEAMQQLFEMQSRINVMRDDPKFIRDDPLPQPDKQDDSPIEEGTIEHSDDFDRRMALLEQEQGQERSTIELLSDNPPTSEEIKRLEKGSEDQNAGAFESVPDNYEAAPPGERFSLRERSLIDARAYAAGKSAPIKDSGCDQDGMSDEEYERIVKAHELVKSEEKNGKAPLPVPLDIPKVQAQSQLAAPTPTFPDPPLPEVLEYDPSLDGPAEGVSPGFSPVNPID